MFLLHFRCLDWTLRSGRGYISPPLAKERSDSIIPPPPDPGTGAAFLRSSTGDSTAGSSAVLKAQSKAQAARDRRRDHLTPRNTEGCDFEFPVRLFPQSMFPGLREVFHSLLSYFSNRLGEFMLVTTLTPAVYKPWARRECVLTQSCPTLRPHGCSLLGSSVNGILQTRILEWVANFSSQWSSNPGDWTCICCINKQIFFFFFC